MWIKVVNQTQRRNDTARAASPLPASMAGLSKLVRAEARLRGRLCATTSIEGLLSEMTKIGASEGLGVDHELLDRHLARVVEVDFPHALAKPSVELELSDINGFAKWRIAALWVAGKLASVVDTPPLGGWPGVFRRRLRKSHPVADTKPADVARPIRTYSNDERELMRAAFDALGEQTWRLHVDWEDQDFGSMVYDEGLHGGRAEPGYLENVLLMHALAKQSLGQRLDGHAYVRLQNASLRYRGDWAVSHDPSPRHLWRHREYVDEGVLTELEPRQFRRLRHRYWEVAAFNYLYGDDMEAFIRDNLVVAGVLIAKYGERPRITARLMDREFFRIEACLMAGEGDPVVVRAMLDRIFVTFYGQMAALAGAAEPARDAQLLEIARLHRRLEYAHPFRDGNTRLSIAVLNKLLVEYGFDPVILAQRNDAPFHTDAEWCRYVGEGMERWRTIRWLAEMALLEHVLSLRPEMRLAERRAARQGRK